MESLSELKKLEEQIRKLEEQKRKLEEKAQKDKEKIIINAAKALEPIINFETAKESIQAIVNGKTKKVLADTVSHAVDSLINLVKDNPIETKRDFETIKGTWSLFIRPKITRTRNKGKESE